MILLIRTSAIFSELYSLGRRGQEWKGNSSLPDFPGY